MKPASVGTFFRLQARMPAVRLAACREVPRVGARPPLRREDRLWAERFKPWGALPRAGRCNKNMPGALPPCRDPQAFF